MFCCDYAVCLQICGVDIWYVARVSCMTHTGTHCRITVKWQLQQILLCCLCRDVDDGSLVFAHQTVCPSNTMAAQTVVSVRHSYVSYRCHVQDNSVRNAIVFFCAYLRTWAILMSRLSCWPTNAVTRSLLDWIRSWNGIVIGNRQTFWPTSMRVKFLHLRPFFQVVCHIIHVTQKFSSYIKAL